MGGLSCFFNDTATTEIYTLSLHDALPISFARSPGSSDGAAPNQASRISSSSACEVVRRLSARTFASFHLRAPFADRKSTRLNSSHANISYAVFCLQTQMVHHELGHLVHIQ